MLVAYLLLAVMPADLDFDTQGNVFCPQQAFQIPLDLSEQDRGRISKIRLFVSEDEGRSWNQYDEVDPSTKVVTFSSRHDGVYWFSLVMMDRQGRQMPADVRDVEPGLKVVIDTIPPAMVLKPIKDKKTGRRGVRWEIFDENLDPRSVRLAISQDAIGRWVPFELQPEDLENKIAWFEDSQNGRKVQAAVRDRAGHEVVWQIEVVGDQYSKGQMDGFVLDGSMVPPRPIPIAQHRPQPPIDYRNQFTPTPATTPVTESMHFASQQYSHNLPPEPENVGIMNSKALAIEYEKSAGGNDSDRIELWGTLDHGRYWSRLGLDTDRFSPIEVNVDRDAVWGLKIVAVSAGATGQGEGPQPGTMPDMYVEVDTQAPKVQLERPEIRNGQVFLQWKVEDINIEEDSVRLLYMSPTYGGQWKTIAEGQWETIAEGMRSSGYYVWNMVEDGITGSIRIRLETQDKAGNLADAEVQIFQPAAPTQTRVIGVKPRPVH